MATYRHLPAITVQATADTTGLNPGNWTNYISSGLLSGYNVPYFEWYHAALINAPVGFTATIIQLPVNVWSVTTPGIGNVSEYAPPHGMKMTPGMEFAFMWNVAATGTPPQVTLFFQYDIDDPDNRLAMGYQ